MSPLKQLIHEIHSRSLWQVLAIYAGASWAVFQVTQTLTEGLGLPDFVPRYALVLLLFGLPIVVATALVQKGPQPARRRDPTLLPDSESQSGQSNALQRLFTWRNAVVGGVLAFALSVPRT